MTTKRKTTKSLPAAELPADLRGRYLLTVYNLEPGGAARRGFDTWGKVSHHLADILSEGRGARAGAERVYVVTILDLSQRLEVEGEAVKSDLRLTSHNDSYRMSGRGNAHDPARRR